jgi:peptidoglycan-N-acetylglucosamine deacetylase
MMDAMARILLVAEILGKAGAVAWWMFDPWSWVGTVFFVAPDLLVLYHMLAPSAQGLCQVFTHFQTSDREVWLTIDDGPDRDDTPQILDLLERHDAHATFFVVGERVARWPHLIAEIIQRGHKIGHHTHTHPLATFWCASRSRLRRELDDATRVLFSAGARPEYFRPPVGIKNLFLATELKARRLHCIGWTIRSGDCLSRRPADVVANVMRQVRPGAILLLHEGVSVPPQVRITAIALLLEALSAQGYRCVLPTVAQLRTKSDEMAKNPPRRLPVPAATAVGLSD